MKKLIDAPQLATGIAKRTAYWISTMSYSCAASRDSPIESYSVLFLMARPKQLRLLRLRRPGAVRVEHRCRRLPAEFDHFLGALEFEQGAALHGITISTSGG